MDHQPVVALYVETGGAYFDLPGVDPWDEPRDARRYDGPHPVVAHPPCQRWGRYWHGSTRKPHQYRLGADGGCFAAALTAVRNWGGVIEHPKDSQAWRYFGLATPPSSGGWVPADAFGGWTCCVWQGHYGHFAGKGTWLYAVPSTPEQLPSLAWGASESGPTPAMVERYGYEKARRVGRMALVGGKDKTRIRNATPPSSEICCCRLLDQRDAPHDPDPTPGLPAAAARRPRHQHHCHLVAHPQGSLMTATNQQPVAEICSASHDDAQFGERAIKPLCDISGFEYGTPLYAGAAPAAVAPQGERQWICPTRTVADLVNNLLTLDQALPAYGAQYIEKDGRRCPIAVPPTVSRERVKDGRWIGQGEDLNAAVVWTRAEQPAAVAGPADELAELAMLNKLIELGAKASYAHAKSNSDDGPAGTAAYVQWQELRAEMGELIRAHKAPAPEAPTAPVDQHLRSALERAHAWMDGQADAQSKGCHATFDMMMLREERDAIAAALAAAPQAPAAPSGEVISANCEFATVRWLHQTSVKGGGDPKNSYSWPITGEKVFLAAPAAPAGGAREPIKPQHPQGMTSVNARLSFNHGWTAAERAHGIRPAIEPAAQAKEGGAS